ncbi:hypothetical protein RHMOL_Rhmol09G0083900 [Rhododendron molle]|uniref:Uncharacterized protein n=1 Tax=Rhododendron molle TaxID=49168 RepID=A0ACC0MCH1_RHOML|nr:hypothetical protein RHMOL_Rhmol09G0083900 [Rhododendron molle]
MMLMYKQKKTGKGRGGNRLLVSVTFPGSTGPIRFVVGEEQLVVGVIQTALKYYAREGRLPVLGSDLNGFVLYCAPAGTEALSPWETIGSSGVRYFMLCKKPQANDTTTDDGKQKISQKGNGSWKAWLNKSLNFKISSH